MHTVSFCLFSNSENQEAPLESQTTPSNVGMVEKEGDNGTDGIMTIEEVLTQLGLDNLIQVFQEEQIDFESLVIYYAKKKGLAVGGKYSRYTSKTNNYHGL